MNTIITRHYPASKLPEDLRDGIDPSSLVTVTIIQRVSDRDEIARARQPTIVTKEEIDSDLHRRGAERDE
jgi:hypothetical protein